MKLPFFKKPSQKGEVAEKIFERELMDINDVIAPAALEFGQGYFKVGQRFSKSFFIFSYPRYLSAVWFSPVINLDIPLDISLFVHPIDTGMVLKQLRRRVTEVQAEMMEREEKGFIRAPELEIAFQDLEGLRDKLMSAQERMFKFGIYVTVYANTAEELQKIEVTLRSILESRLIYIKPALFQQQEGFIASSPYGLDPLSVHTTMNTEPLSSVFPFVSFDLSSNEGILYGVNRHNNSLILFDRFSLENANMVIFAKSGSGKSYMVKLELLRSLMLGEDCIILDPENEYQFLSDAVGGSFFRISLNSTHHINPFDLPLPRENEMAEDILRSNIINLVGLLRIMLGGLTPEEDAVLDRALTETYAAKDISPEVDPSLWGQRIPLMSDLETVLENMEGAESLVKRIRKFTKGTFAGFFNQPTNISMENKMVVFALRDMEEELKTMAMFVVMRYIWNTVRSTLKKRILVIDEAWWMMQSEDSASFLFGTCKRARKYYLGVSTITQDVSDFMKSTYGQPIINDSSLQVLMKQSPAAIDVIQSTFNLTDEEKYLLLEAEVGEGLFFAGQKHVAIKVIASYVEDQIITTSPEQLLAIKKAKEELAQGGTGEIVEGEEKIKTLNQ